MKLEEGNPFFQQGYLGKVSYHQEVTFQFQLNHENPNDDLHQMKQ